MQGAKEAQGVIGRELHSLCLLVGDQGSIASHAGALSCPSAGGRGCSWDGRVGNSTGAPGVWLLSWGCGDLKPPLPLGCPWPSVQRQGKPSGQLPQPLRWPQPGLAQGLCWQPAWPQEKFQPGQGGRRRK